MFKHFPQSRRLSCGVLILNPERELLLCHVTGQDYWDLPKGGMDAGETPVQTAARETLEETGLELDPDHLLDLGRLPYTAKKDLHLFAILMPRFELTHLHCDSQFSQLPSGRRQPEMDGYDWVGFSRIAQHCTPKMTLLLQSRLDLTALTDRLLAAAVAPEPGTAPQAAFADESA